MGLARRADIYHFGSFEREKHGRITMIQLQIARQKAAEDDGVHFRGVVSGLQPLAGGAKGNL